MHERCEQEKGHTNEQSDVRDVIREHLNIDEVDHSPIEPAISAKHSVDEVAQRSAENESESNGFDTSRCITEHDHDHHNDTDRYDSKDGALVGEDRETGACVEGEPEIEHIRDDDDRSVSKRVDSPGLGQLIDRCNNEADDNSELSVAQPRWAASTVVVAYGIASSRATGIGSPVTSHIPYRPFSIRS